MADTYDSILQSLKSKTYKPVYFLQGDEPYFIDLVSDYIEDNVLGEAERGFNQTIFYGKDTDPQSVIDTAKRYPMMSEHQVVIVKEAQSMRGVEKLDAYIQNPLSSTLLVICYKYKKLDKRTAFAKTVQGKGVLLDSKKLYDNQVPQWVERTAVSLKLKISPRVAVLITEHLGNDLSKIANELKKLKIILPEGGEITPEIVEKNIGISKDYNAFELQNAIAQRDVLKSNRIVNYFMANPKAGPLAMLLGTLFSFFSKVYLYHGNKHKSDKEIAGVLKVNPFFIKDYRQAGTNFDIKHTERVFTLLHEYDLKLKGIDNGGTIEGQLLKEMVYRILH